MNAITHKKDARLNLNYSLNEMQRAWAKLAQNMKKVEQALDEQKRACDTFKGTNRQLGQVVNNLGKTCQSYEKA